MEPVSLSIIGCGMLAAAFTGILGNRTDAVVKYAGKKLLNSVLEADRLTNHDLQKAVERSYIKALDSVCTECITDLAMQTDTTDHRNEYAWLHNKKALLQKELNDPAKIQYRTQSLNTLRDIELLLTSGNGIDTHKIGLIRDKIIVFADDEEAPEIYRRKINSVLFEKMCTYFAYEIKYNEIVRNIFQSQVLASLDIEAHNNRLTIDLIANSLSEVSSAFQDILFAVEKEAAKTRRYIDDKFENLTGKWSREMQSEEPDIDLSRLPIPSVSRVFGRDHHLEELKQHLNDSRVSLVSVIAFAGVGKSTLVDSFLASVAPFYGNSGKVFGWHFYSQENRDTTIANSSLFFETALRFFGFQGELPQHDNLKAKELLKLIQSYKTILVLDGIEPLQYPTHINQGYFRDNAMQIFLTDISRQGLRSGALVIATSRQPLVETERFSNTKRIDLDNLDEGASIDLLKSLGVRGTNSELRSTAIDYKYHAFSLVLLGRLLVSDYKGDCRQRAYVNLHESEMNEEAEGILAYYDKTWSDESPEKIFLFLLCLFNRPMQNEEFEVLRASSDLAQPLKQLRHNELNRIMGHLSSSGLIIEEGGFYDTHSIIRTYFAKLLEKRDPHGFIQSHRVLFEYFQRIPDEDRPKDLDGLEPLYRAVFHGCMAHEYAAALEVYWRRICRGREFYSQKKLGAIGSDLFVVSQFFLDGWEQIPAEGLRFEQRSWLLAVASFLLTALGRFEEAIELRKTEIESFKILKDWRLTSGDLRNLMRILLSLGRLKEAQKVGEDAIGYVKRMNTEEWVVPFSKDMDTNFIEVSCLATKAEILHRLGMLQDSLSVFKRAEELYGRMLDRTNGFYFCCLLLDLGNQEEDYRGVVARGRYGLDMSTGDGKYGNMGNDNLTIAKALFLLDNYEQAGLHFNTAINLLLQSGRIDRMPHGLISRASYYRKLWLETKDSKYRQLCTDDMEEAYRILTISRMGLYEVDHLVLQSNILVDDNKIEKANVLYQKATKLAQHMHYHSIFKELEEVKKRISGVTSGC